MVNQHQSTFFVIAINGSLSSLSKRDTTSQQLSTHTICNAVYHDVSDCTLIAFFVIFGSTNFNLPSKHANNGLSVSLHFNRVSVAK